MEPSVRTNRTMRTSGAKGLVNEPGSNNCFLNSAVQVLWHLDAFRRNFRLLSAHRCTRDSCIFCALKVVFTQLEYSDHAQIAPDQLRKALAACTSYLPADDDVNINMNGSFNSNSNSTCTFALGSMADACECLENILLRLHAHLDYSPPGSTACYAHHCLTHAKFAMRVSECVQCSLCAARGTPCEYAQLVYYVATHAILTNVRSSCSSDAYGIPDAFGRALKAAASGDERECPAACGQQRLPLLRRLISAPDVLGVGLVWNSASPGASTLTTLYESISTSLRVQDLFDAVASPECLAPYQLVGLVCYVGRHYATFMLHSRAASWILFDDSNVKEIGRSWHLVVARCLKCRFVPVLLLYANAQAVPIDADCVPQNTVQISNAQLLCAVGVDPSPTSSLSRSRHERTGSNNANSPGPERAARTHKKTRAAVGVFQARVRNAASVDNLHEPQGDNEEASASLSFALGFTDRAAANKSTLPLRPRAVTRRDSQRAGRTAETDGPLKRHKSLENMLDASVVSTNTATSFRGDESDCSSGSSFNVHARLAQTNEQVDPKAIEALGFRWQFSDLIAKADILLRDAAACEQEVDYTDALLRFTQAAICLKQASDLPAIEQNSRLAAVSRQNLCNASIKRLHRQLNLLASAATRATLPGSDGDSSMSPVAGANRQDSGISTWSEGDPSGHSTASEDFTVAHAEKPTYAETLTRLGPYSTLPRKPKLRQLNSVTSSDADTDMDRQHQSASAAHVPVPVLRADSVPADLTLSPPVQNQPVVFSVRSTRRVARNDESHLHATPNSAIPHKTLPPTQLNTPQKFAASQPCAADIRQRLESLRPSQVTAVRHVTPLNAPTDRHQAAVCQLNPTTAAYSRIQPLQPVHGRETELDLANQTHAIVARSAGHKAIQPNRTPQLVRKVVDVTPNGSGTLAHSQSPQPQLNVNQVAVSYKPTVLANDQPNSWQNSTQTIAQSETPMTGLRPSTIRRMAKKKVTFLDDLIEKQAERVRHNMAQLVSSRNAPPPAGRNPGQQREAFESAPHHANVARVKALTANDCKSRLPINVANEDLSDSSLTSNNSNSTRNSAEKANVHRFTSLSLQSRQRLGYPTRSGHDADSETDSSIVSWNGNGRPVGNGSQLCQLCQCNSTEQSDSYCSACAAYMSRLL